MSFAAEIAVDQVLDQVKAALAKVSGSVLDAFHQIDKDNSNQLNTDEFAAVLKQFGIVLPARQLGMLIARFDANGDGSVSIPEFSTFLSGNKTGHDALRNADAIPDEPVAAPQGFGMGMGASRGRMSAPTMMGAKPLTVTDFQFLSRMEADVEERRRTSFLVELRKDPRFRPSMLEPPKPKFQTVTLHGGPIIKSHSGKKTGLETRRPYQWGPLGGFY